MLGVFAQRFYSELDGTMTKFTGIIEGDFQLLLWQLAACVLCGAWSFCMTYGLLFVMGHIPGVSLALTDKDFEEGLDNVEMGETTFSYIKVLHEEEKKRQSMNKRTSAIFKSEFAKQSAIQEI